MTLTRKIPPSALPVTQESVFEHLRLILAGDGGSPPESLPIDAAHVLRVTEAAVSEIDGANGYLGVALITQGLHLRLDRFGPRIALPVPPLQSVDAVKYIDTAGVEQILSPTAYRVSRVGGLERAILSPVAAWPATSAVPEAVTIEFTAGFGDDPEDVPAAIRGALLEIIASRYRYRETMTAASGVARLPDSATAALDNFKDWTFA